MILEVVRALLRRWYLLLLGVALTVGLIFGASTASPPAYEARGLVLMLPSQVAVGKGGNPLLALDGLEQPASILVAHYASALAHDEVAAISSTAQFTVLLDATIRGPVIAIDVTDDSPDAAMAVLKHLVDDIPKQLNALQQQVQASSNAYIGSMALSVDKVPTENRSATLRLMIAALVIGAVATVVATSGFDAFMQGRRSSRSRHRGRRAMNHDPDGAADQSPDRVDNDDVFPAPSVEADETGETVRPRRGRRRTQNATASTGTKPDKSVGSSETDKPVAEADLAEPTHDDHAWAGGR